MKTQLRKLSVAARSSPLSQAQVREVFDALQTIYPDIDLRPTFVQSHGDRDQTTSLRVLGQTDFFTREVDRLVIDGACDVSVHSAKDLPDPLPEGLVLVALTEGVDPSDVLVLRAGETLCSLRSGARIATSSERREQVVSTLRSDLTFVDIRGTIEKRLERLFCGEFDGVVIARAALIRLQLNHLNCITLPGETTALQGRLAVLARLGDREMEELFASLNR